MITKLQAKKTKNKKTTLFSLRRHGLMYLISICLYMSLIFIFPNSPKTPSIPDMMWSINLPVILSFIEGSFSDDVLTLRNFTRGLIVIP